MNRILLLFLLLTSGFAYAKPLNMFPQGDFSELRKTGSALVKSIIDPQTIQLEDGFIVRLAGIEFPDFNPDNPGDFSVTTVNILRDMLEGKTVALYQTPDKEEGRVNRMGQQLAHVQRQDGKIWVQGTLIGLGLARTLTTASNPQMAQQMYDLEQDARNQKAGIWEKDALKILTPEEAKDHIGSIQIVEGRVESATIRQNRIYLNFGKDWKSDFTVSIAPEYKRVFSKNGLDPLQWNGRTLRVRGWLESYNGPYMQIDHPQAIEEQVIQKVIKREEPKTEVIKQNNALPAPLPDDVQMPMVKTLEQIR